MKHFRDILQAIALGGLLVGLAAWLLAPGDGGATLITGTAQVIDGDSLKIAGREIRLFGIDAPEGQQKCRNESGNSYDCGRQAAAGLTQLISGKPVTCEREDVDRYDRVVGRCKTGATNINAWMVEQGLALAYRRYTHDFVAAEMTARQQKRGMWQGTFTAPWAWRKANR